MTGTYNAALIRFQGGHVYLDRSGTARPREVYIEMGGIKHVETATAIGDEILALYRAERITEGIAGQVRTAVQVPTVGYQLGDTMAGSRLTSYAVSMEGDGLVSVVPEVGDPVEIRQAQIDRKLARAGSGMRSEYAKPNIVDPAQGAGTDTTPPEFSVSGEVVPSLSPAWRATRPWWCAWLDVQLVTAGSVPTKVQLLRGVGSGWVEVAWVGVAAGATRGIVAVNEGWPAGGRLVLTCQSSGGGAADLTATLRGTMV